MAQRQKASTRGQPRIGSPYGQVAQREKAGGCLVRLVDEILVRALWSGLSSERPPRGRRVVLNDDVCRKAVELRIGTRLKGSFLSV